MQPLYLSKVTMPNLGPNPDLNTALIRGLYWSILGREPEASALTQGIKDLNRGVSVQQIAIDLIWSVENWTNEITSIFQQCYNRNPDDASVNAALAQLNNGTNIDLIRAYAFGSDEFKALMQATVATTTPPLTPDAATLLAAINVARASQTPSLPPYVDNPILQLKLAQPHASFMAKVQILSHNDAGDGSFLARLEASGYPSLGGDDEIIARDTSVLGAMNQWMGEEPPNDPHRQAILSNCTQAGCASAVASNGMIFYCCDFGS